MEIRHLVVGFRYCGWVAIAIGLEIAFAHEFTGVHLFQASKE